VIFINNTYNIRQVTSSLPQAGAQLIPTAVRKTPFGYRPSEPYDAPVCGKLHYDMDTRARRSLRLRRAKSKAPALQTIRSV